MPLLQRFRNIGNTNNAQAATLTKAEAEQIMTISHMHKTSCATTKHDFSTIACATAFATRSYGTSFRSMRATMR